MKAMERAFLLVSTQKCYREYFEKYNFLHVECFKILLSKCLGIVLIAGSLLVKVPQIIKLYKSKSARGISLLSVTLDLTAITVYMSYNFVKAHPFTAWGDSAFLAIQTAIIGALVLMYENSVPRALGYLSVYVAVCSVLMGGFTPVELLWTMQGFNIPVILSGKLTQAYENYKNGHTGQLSAITLFMLFFGSLARIFTSIQETGDFMVILTYLVSSFANGVLVLQLLYYWKVDVTKPKSD